MDTFRRQSGGGKCQPTTSYVSWLSRKGLDMDVSDVGLSARRLQIFRNLNFPFARGAPRTLSSSFHPPQLSHKK